MLKENQKGFAHLILLLLAIFVIALICFAGWRVYQKNFKTPSTKNSAGQTVSYDQTASRRLTGGTCSGAGSVNIIPPMKLEQVSFVLPYGGVIGGHVTPIDHQYYNGLNPHAVRDSYDVVAPADGRIVNIQHRGDKSNTPAHSPDQPSSDEYRIVIAHSCSFLTYVDLVTSLAPNILAKLPGGHTLHNSDNVNVNISVKQGQTIGYIGGQTLDFAVWDLTKSLKGFVNPANYDAEEWKIYTAPPTAYYQDSIKNQVVAKYIRTSTPIDGKIDYDIDGKLVGNWFLQGSGGYHDMSNHAPNYWAGHLSIAPDYLDPSVYVASIGNFASYPMMGAHYDNRDGSGAAQLLIKSAAPDPTTIGRGILAKYELVQKQYTLSNGQLWGSDSFATGVKATAGDNNSVVATALAELTDNRTLKFEIFPGKTSSAVTTFDSNAKIYTR